MAKAKKAASSSKKKPIEQYDHKGKKRVNNPPVGLVTPATDREIGKKSYAYDPHLDPQLVWAGKAERTSFEVPTVSLHVHERIDPRTIFEASRRNSIQVLLQQCPNMTRLLSASFVGHKSSGICGTRNERTLINLIRYILGSRAMTGLLEVSSACVTEIRAMDVEQASSRRRLDDLFQSILHRAFNGEL
jgi:hypothetical protein